jgi:quercetin 2,3-dioxygenase
VRKDAPEKLKVFRTKVIIVNEQRVAVGDGIAAIDESELTIAAEEDAEFILVDAA